MTHPDPWYDGSSFWRDKDYEEYLVVEVRRDGDGWEVKRDDGWWWWLGDDENTDGWEPHVGHVLRFYPSGLGLSIRGVVHVGTTLRYRTPDQQKSHMRELLSHDLR